MACSQSHYPVSAGVNVRGTDRRAHGWKTTRKIEMLTEVSPGTVVRKPDGSWGEARYDVHQLIQYTGRIQVVS